MHGQNNIKNSMYTFKVSKKIETFRTKRIHLEVLNNLCNF